MYNYKDKYIKYKTKYLQLKEQLDKEQYGGMNFFRKVKDTLIGKEYEDWTIEDFNKATKTKRDLFFNKFKVNSNNFKKITISQLLDKNIYYIEDLFNNEPSTNDATELINYFNKITDDEKKIFFTLIFSKFDNYEKFKSILTIDNEKLIEKFVYPKYFKKY